MAIVTGSILVDLLIATLLLVYAIYRYLTKDFNYWQNRNVEHVKPLPFFGNFKDVITMKTSIGLKLADLYNKTVGDFFGVWIFGTPYLVVRNPELVKNILVKDFDYFHNRSLTNNKTADPIASHMLFVAQNPEWRSLRTKLTPVFTSGKIKNMLPLINHAGEEMKNYLTKHSGQIVEMKEFSAKFSTDVITSCSFGLEAGSFHNEDAPFREVGRKMFTYNVPNSIRASAYFYAHFLVKALNLTFFEPSIYEFCSNAFWDTIKQREASQTKRNDVIDLLIDIKNKQSLDGLKFEGDVIVAQAFQFFAAGFETTSSTIAFTLYELCLHENIQTKLRKEIKECSEKYGYFTYESIQSMKYLDKVVKETLRKYPVLPFLDRRCTKDYKLPGSNVVVEKGTAIYIPMFGLHYDPRYFPDPERYDPERFSEEKVASRPSYAYIPFGDGPHNCIGERFGLIVSKLGIVHVLSQFAVERCEKTDVPIEYDHKSFVLQAKNGLNMKVIDLKQQISVAA